MNIDFINIEYIALYFQNRAIEKYKIYKAISTIMETRKVQFTGGSSYIISLPKSWIKKVGIKKNDTVQIALRPDMSLLIIPHNNTLKNNSIKIFNADTYNANTLYRSLIGAYISGYKEIKIRSSGEIPSDIRNIVSEFVRSAIGVEIIEEMPNEILIRDILNPTEISFVKIIKRMYVIIRGMYDDILLSLRTHNFSLVSQIISRDIDVDRLHWLMARRQNLIFKNPHLNLEKEENLCNSYSTLTKTMERIGDHLVNLSKNILEIGDKLYDDQIKSLLYAGEYAYTIFEASMKSLINKDIYEAHTIIGKVDDLKKLCDNIRKKALNNGDPKIAVHLSNMSESIRRIGEYSSDICEYVIDYLI